MSLNMVFDMVEETRYWKKVGLRITKAKALEIANRMTIAASYLDEDLEEFTAAGASDDEAKREIESLFTTEDEYTEGDPVDPTVLVISMASEWHKERKPRLLEIRSEVEKEFKKMREEEITQDVEENSIADEVAATTWDDTLKNRVAQEANLRWDEEYNARIEALQEELGLLRND